MTNKRMDLPDARRRRISDGKYTRWAASYTAYDIKFVLHLVGEFGRRVHHYEPLNELMTISVLELAETGKRIPFCAAWTKYAVHPHWSSFYYLGPSPNPVEGRCCSWLILYSYPAKVMRFDSYSRKAFVGGTRWSRRQCQ